MGSTDLLESRRIEVQEQLDASKGHEERNRLGQFATPPPLAAEILACAKHMLGNQQIRFLDPAFGTGSFYSALLKTFPKSHIKKALGFEIDPHYGNLAHALWRDSGLELHVSDFTKATPPQTESERATLMICNPPYVRHHHISVADKWRLQRRSRDLAETKLNGLAGLYCHFVCISHAWLAENGLAGWLIPSEFMDVNYGIALKQYLTQKVTLILIHRFDPQDVQFDDALVSSAVVWFNKGQATSRHEVLFTYGGSLLRPRLKQTVSLQELKAASKWTRYPRPSGLNEESGAGTFTLKDLFEIKRGLATGSNEFFILRDDAARQFRLPKQFLVPILPSPRYLRVDEVESDEEGNPQIEPKLFLLACSLPEKTIEERHPTLWAYLQKGKEGKIDEGYLCRHRDPWYAQEDRPSAPLLCTYMGRNGGKRKPFRFILNHSRSTAANTYLLLYPKPHLKKLMEQNRGLIRALWKELNQFSVDKLIGEGRIYGGGLYKLEPKELGNVPIDNVISAVMPHLRQERILSKHKQLTLVQHW